MKNITEMTSKFRPNLLKKGLGFLFFIFVSLIFLGNAVAQTACSGTGDATDLACGLAGYWNLDEGVGTAAHDSSGNGNNGTLEYFNSSKNQVVTGSGPVNGPTWTTSANPGTVAVGGGALSFNGNSMVDLGPMNALDGAKAASWSFWIKLPAVPSKFETFLSRYNAGGGDAAQSWLIGTGMGSGSGGFNNVALFFNSTSNAYNSTKGIEAINLQGGIWYHIVFLYDGTQSSSNRVQLYINDTAQTVTSWNVPASIPIPTTGQGLSPLPDGFMGSTANFTNSYFNGIIDDVRIYNRVLSPAEITSLFNLGSAETGASTTPAVPINFTSSSVQDTQATISWSSPVGTAALPTGYNVYKNGTLIQSTGLTTYTDNFLTPNTTYLYTVAAYNGQGSSQLISAQTAPLVVTTTPSIFPTPSPTGSTTQAGQACTSTDLNGLSCATLGEGFSGGTLACKADGSGYDVSGCIHGNLIQAASCNQVDVQAAIDAAQNGDTVQVPAGLCYWQTSVVIGMSVSTNSYVLHTTPKKSIVLKGAGIDKTIIYDQRKLNQTYTGANGIAETLYPLTALAIQNDPSTPIRVTGFTFDETNSIIVQGAIGINGTLIDSTTGTTDLVHGFPRVPMARVDHCKFNNLMEDNGIVMATDYGLVDHDTFNQGNATPVNGISINGDMDAAFDRPLSLGTANALYMEDNDFEWTYTYANGAYDAYVGARYVLRYNIINGTSFGHHGFDSSARGTFSWEVYNNRFFAPSGDTQGGGESRSGTGVLFNNLVPPDGNWYAWGWLVLRNYRDSDWDVTNDGVSFPWYNQYGAQWNGSCNGASYLLVEVASSGYGGYKAGDVLSLLQTNGQGVKVTNGTGATVRVTAVDATGHVTGVEPITAGNGYIPYTSGLQTTDLTTSNPNGGALIGIGMDGNQPGAEGYPCEDQNGVASILNSDGKTLSYQAPAPIYAWNNNLMGTIGGQLVVGTYGDVETGIPSGLLQLATGVSTVSIANGGSGYNVGDVLNIVQSGGSGATVTVTSVNNGVITGVEITPNRPLYIGTGYTTANGVATSPKTGNGSGATLNITVPQNYTITLGSGGSGYKVNDVLEINHQPNSYDAFVTVTGVDGNGAITSFVENPGTAGTGYTIANNLPSSYLSDTGSGTGATFNITAIDPLPTTQTFTVTLSNAGSGYKINDMLNVLQAGASGALVKVLAVDSNGAITDYQGFQTTTVSGYTTSSGLGTSYFSSPTNGITNVNNGTMGTGTGATFNLTAGQYYNTASERNSLHIQEGRDFYNCLNYSQCASMKTPLTYVPYPYPHPWAQMDFPIVSIISPVNSSTLANPISITANVVAPNINIATISSVSFYDNSTVPATLLGTVTSPVGGTGNSYAYTWNNASAGTHSITVVATDSMGNAGTTSAVNITVTSSSTYPLTVSASGNGMIYGSLGSSVNPNSYIINCGINPDADICSQTESTGNVITLSAVPATGSTFTGWSGACSGPGTCTLTMNAAKNVTANFVISTVNGECGSAAQTYLYGTTGFGSNELCKSGNPSPSTVAFPSPGENVKWTCVGLNNGFNSTCSAKRNPRTIVKLL